MRNHERIPLILTKLQTVWENYPDMRLLQLILMAVELHDLEIAASPAGTKKAIPDLFHLEDDCFLELLEKFKVPSAPHRYILEVMIASVTPDNIGSVINFGPPGGKEILEQEYGMFDNFKDLSERFASDPNNGIQGFWVVEGVRHKSIVRASSAPEAVGKALKSDTIGEWELLDVKFLGSEMPDIFEY